MGARFEHWLHGKLLLKISVSAYASAMLHIVDRRWQISTCAETIKRKRVDKHAPRERCTARMRASVVLGLALVFCGATAAALTRAYAGAAAPLPPAASDSRLLDKQVALMMAARGAF
jgi:hypothetical protein